MFVSSLFITKHLFYERYLIISYIFSHKIKVTILNHICNIEFCFINKRFVGIICKRFEIKL